jgi:amidase
MAMFMGVSPETVGSCTAAPDLGFRRSTRMDELGLWSLGQLRSALRDKKVSSAELLEIYIRRVERLNPLVNAVVALDLVRAREAAGSADDDAARGEWTGPLHGVPFTVKDAIETEGIRSTGGAVELSAHVPLTDPPAVARLKRAGGILFGKTNLPAWSGEIETHNSLFGVTNNPWDLTRTVGGSSGGAAAAVATGMTGFDMGTDIGGSIRIPSSYCGVFGHKPTFGIVPQRGYLDHVGGGTVDADINVFGPIARSVPDLALLLDVLVGPGDDDALGWTLKMPKPRAQALRDFRIGSWLDDPAAEVASDVGAVLSATVDRLAEAGVPVSTDHPQLDLGHVYDTYTALVLAAVSIRDDTPGEYQVDHAAWLRLTQERARIRRVWGDWFQAHDVLLCPVMPMAPFRHNLEGDPLSRSVMINGRARSYLQSTLWNGLVGMAYLPSTVVPVGRTSDGVPVGMQVVGPYLEDRTALTAAHLISGVLGPWEPPPLAL